MTSTQETNLVTAIFVLTFLTTFFLYTHDEKEVTIEFSKSLLDRVEESERQAKAYRKVTNAYGCKHLKDHQAYLTHQMGCTGIKSIIKAQRVKKYRISKQVRKNMAGNSPLSYATLSRTGGADKFLKHWQRKWETTKQIILTQRG